ncbi:MAG: hypothetical protein WCR45_07360 [Bacteroidaceae bacterium]
MIGFIIWIIGLVLTIRATIEIWNMGGETAKRLLAIIILLITNWIGLILYYFVFKPELPKWLK